jgi:hypothetical protein
MPDARAKYVLERGRPPGRQGPGAVKLHLLARGFGVRQLRLTQGIDRIQGSGRSDGRAAGRVHGCYVADVHGIKAHRMPSRAVSTWQPQGPTVLAQTGPPKNPVSFFRRVFTTYPRDLPTSTS